MGTFTIILFVIAVLELIGIVWMDHRRQVLRMTLTADVERAERLADQRQKQIDEYGRGRREEIAAHMQQMAILELEHKRNLAILHRIAPMFPDDPDFAVFGVIRDPDWSAQLSCGVRADQDAGTETDGQG